MSERDAARHHAAAIERRRTECIEALEADNLPEALYALGKLMKHIGRLHPEGSLVYEKHRATGKGLLAWARMLRTQD